ncbi:MAG: Opr family porin [Candidatus Marinarcus sp.]|uniref:Opr family porin n=1 Tax=Candidatus Marinarcus sp. TaxID=3100987 RepID=UPI003B0010FB
MKKLSLVACGLLISSSALFAESSTIKEAFANGKASGDITVYTENVDAKGGTADSALTSGSIGLSFETDTIYGISAKVGFRGNHELDSKESGDYVASYANKGIITEANVKYEDDNVALIIGRQAIDLEWLGDYNDAVVGVIKAVPNTSIILGYTNRKAEIGIDTQEDFTEITKDGAYVLDVQYTGVEGLLINPYYYSALNFADFYGTKVAYDTDMFGVTAHYAQTNEDVSTTDDGDILNLEARLNVAGVALAAGYIQTDKTGAVGSMSAYGDNINPFDDGTNVYGTDATTYYGSASYTIADVSLTALYGTTEYGTTNTDTDELNLIVGYNFTEELSASVTYVNYDDTAAAKDYDKVYANVTYAF